MAETLGGYPTPDMLKEKEAQEALVRKAIQEFTKSLSRADLAYADLPKLYRQEAERLEEID